jgi:hypothetical protein
MNHFSLLNAPPQQPNRTKWTPAIICSQQPPERSYVVPGARQWSGDELRGRLSANSRLEHKNGTSTVLCAAIFDWKLKQPWCGLSRSPCRADATNPPPVNEAVSSPLLDRSWCQAEGDTGVHHRLLFISRQQLTRMHPIHFSQNVDCSTILNINTSLPSNPCVWNWNRQDSVPLIRSILHLTCQAMDRQAKRTCLHLSLRSSVAFFLKSRICWFKMRVFSFSNASNSWVVAKWLIGKLGWAREGYLTCSGSCGVADWVTSLFEWSFP